jgi:hypothetical protein
VFTRRGSFKHQRNAFSKATGPAGAPDKRNKRNIYAVFRAARCNRQAGKMPVRNTIPDYYTTTAMPKK